MSFKLKTNVIKESSLTQAGKNVITEIYASMDAFLADKNFDYKAASAYTTELYNQLSATERADVKTAIQMWVNTSDLIILKTWFFPDVQYVG